MVIPKPKSKQPLPKNASRVFKGVIFDVYQWKQKMFDGSIETYEKLKRQDTVIVFPIMHDGKILLTKQEQPGKKPFIGATGGRVEKGEEIIDAAKRELLEESGYEADEYIFWKSVQPISKIEWSVYIFIARNLKKVAPPKLDSGEKIELMPVNFDEFLEVALQPNFYEQEIYRDAVEAKLDERKKEELKKLFWGM
ncbi:NUDIX hydrolase [Candidatus Woesebacteria bacterium]|nr:MAG: NUDIX hydrolase [Candidatus Woesebacteria bacterium]